MHLRHLPPQTFLAPRLFVAYSSIAVTVLPNRTRLRRYSRPQVMSCPQMTRSNGIARVGLMMEVGGDLHARKTAAHRTEHEEQEESRELPAEPASGEYRQ